MGSQDRAKFIAEKAKSEEKSKDLPPAAEASSSSSSKPSKKKSKAAAITASSQATPYATAARYGGSWEVIPQDRPKFSVPAMPVAPAVDEPHRLPLRDLVKNKIQELEFRNALELFASVARLVSKDEEVARNPKAQAALDEEWENLRSKGVWDESRVKECRKIVDDARAAKQTVHLGRIFEACYEKGAELDPGNPLRKFKGRTVFQGPNLATASSKLMQCKHTSKLYSQVSQHG